MSIELTRLSHNQGSDIKYIKKWFEENATEYFDKCEIVDDKALVLKKSGWDYLYLSREMNYSARIIVNEDLSIPLEVGTADYISRLVKTPHGIAMGFSIKDYYSKEFPYGIFISKTNMGNIGVIGNSLLGEPTMESWYYFESIGGSKYPEATRIAANVINYDHTTFTPVICDKAKGEYMPDCFFTTLSQYNGLDCTFTADGTEYLYNGFIAMR